MNTLRIGARGSDLSLAQTRALIDQLRAADPEVECEIIIIETHGDRDQTTALDQLWPPGGFVKEIERALIDGEIDAAVHSLKDVPTESPEELVVAAVPQRAEANDVLLSRDPVELDALPNRFSVGSSSPRRTHQILLHAPQVGVVPIRGNVPTRIEKLMRGEYDGVILAAAGLHRLGIQHPHSIPLPLEEFPPAPGQGALAVQTRRDSPAREIVSVIDHVPTRLAVAAERAFLQGTGGGCHAAAGAFARIEEGTIHLLAQLFIDGVVRTSTMSDGAHDPEALGRAMAKRLQSIGEVSE